MVKITRFLLKCLSLWGKGMLYWALSNPKLTGIYYPFYPLPSFKRGISPRWYRHQEHRERWWPQLYKSSMDVAAFQTKRNQHSYCLFFPCCCIRPELNHEVVPSHIKSGLESLRDQRRINFGRRCRQAGSGNDSDIKITHTLSGNVQEHWVTSWKLALNPGSKSQISTTLLSYAMETALLFTYLDFVSIKMSNLGLWSANV